jgi:hypothetical protein
MNNPGRLAAAPHGRESDDADEIIYAALKALNLLCGFFGEFIHISGRHGGVNSTRPKKRADVTCFAECGAGERDGC